ncbi:MAG: DUF4397 domain-containing protein [Acidimicrobiia bacterium]
MRRLMTILVAAMMAISLLALPAIAADGDAELSVVHGITDTAVDVYANGAPVPGLQNWTFGNVAGPLTLPSGDYLIEIYGAGAGPSGGETAAAPVLSGTVALPPGGNVTAVAYLAGDGSGAGTASLAAFNNDTTLTNVGQGRVTARHLANAPAVDVLAGGAVLFGNVSNGQSGAADVPPGTYGVSINAAGTPTQVFPATGTADIGVSTNTSVIAYAIGDINGEFTVVPQIINLGSASAGYANVSIVHGVPGVTVDVYLNGNLAVAGFAPETITPRMLMPAGTYDIAIYAAGANPLADKPVIEAPGVAVPAGVNASVVAHYDADGKLTASVFIDDLSMTNSGEGRLTVRHTASAPAVDVLAGGSVVFSDVVNGDSEEADLPAATYDVTLNAAGTPNQVFPASGAVSLPLAEGANTFVYAIGGPGELEAFTLIVGIVDGIGGFSDIDDSVHKNNIIKMTTLGITRVEDSYRPGDDVTRGEMAAFLRRALNLPGSSTDYFTDDDDSIFENDINAIAAYGITLATGGKYLPDESVTRGQMAAFIKRGFQIGAGGATPFTDIDTSIFKGDIEAIYGANITVGTSPTTFSPDDNVTRGQMATFLARALGLE